MTDAMGGGNHDRAVIDAVDGIGDTFAAGGSHRRSARAVLIVVLALTVAGCGGGTGELQMH